MTIKAVITDIEGTTSSISFVHDVLFPYAKKNMAGFITQLAKSPEVARELDAVRREIDQPAADLSTIISTLEQWIADDRKITPLKTLQGYIWKQGFASGEFKSHMYSDAVDGLRAWNEQGIVLAVYSSGSVGAQKLLFGYSEYGDLTPLISHYFDTSVGAKQQPGAYQAIAENLHEQHGLVASELLFLSDVEAELDAAMSAGLKTGWLIRNNQPETGGEHRRFSSFDEVARHYL